jgi:hypothetical protein
LKSVCTVYQDKSYNDAAKFCAANNMTLYNADSAEEKKALVDYTNVQWPFGTFWVEGNHTNCSVVTNDNRINFEMAEDKCKDLNYFDCEYGSEFHNVQYLLEKLIINNKTANSPSFKYPDEPEESKLYLWMYDIAFFSFNSTQIDRAIPRMQCHQKS